MTDDSHIHDEAAWSRLLVQPWVVTVVLLHAAGWCIYRQAAPVDMFSPAVYAFSTVASASFWLLLNLLRDAVGRVLRGVVALVASAFAIFVAVGNYKVYTEFGEFLSASMVGYAGKGGVSTLTHYVETYLEYPLDVLFVGGLVVLWSIWMFVPRAEFFQRKQRLRVGAAVLGLFVVSLSLTALYSHRRHLAPDAAIFTAGLRTLYMPDQTRLHTPNRVEVPEPSPSNNRSPPNVVLVINESLGTHEVDFDDEDADDMPFFEGWLATDPQRTFAFQRAYANSTSTDISVPSLLTGLGPHRSAEEFHEVPVAWNWARAAGLQPFYVSAQNYSSTDFPEFFFADDPMPVLRPNTIEELGESGDFSVDELYIAETFGELLEKMPDDAPVFAIYNSNAMHKPFQESSPLLDEQPARGSPYRNALYVLDQALKRIVEALRRDGRLEQTLFIMTSDHGEYTSQTHRLPRILSVYEEFTRVPMVVRVPSDWPEKRPAAMEGLDGNVERNVANIDIVPTLVDALGFDEPASRSIRSRLTGSSLLAPVNRARNIIVLNNNAARHWEHQSFGIYWADWRFVFSDVQGPRLFDLRDDPEQKSDLWDRAPKPVRDRVLRTIRDHEPLSEIWEKRAHGTPGLKPVFP